MICKNCGAQIPDDSKFCFECGNQVEAETPKITEIQETVQEVHDTGDATIEEAEEILEVKAQRVDRKNTRCFQ
ncbi:MAG: zinc ribbon domain-containing protein [Firmicutes bacterium]|nr:zinc ribbon domain-containing protein [Bacillota bacterium]